MEAIIPSFKIVVRLPIMPIKSVTEHTCTCDFRASAPSCWWHWAGQGWLGTWKVCPVLHCFVSTIPSAPDLMPLAQLSSAP